MIIRFVDVGRNECDRIAGLQPCQSVERKVDVNRTLFGSTINVR